MPSAHEPAFHALSPSGGPPVLDPETVAAETLNLRRDLWLFRTAYLPVLLRSANPGLVERWQWTVQGLADALPREDGSRGAALVEDRVVQLLRTGYPEAEYLLTPLPNAYLTVGGRLRWHVYPHSGETIADREEHVRYVLRWAGAGDERADAPWMELRRVLSAVQEFFLALPPTLDKRMGGYVSVLPILAELDPPFAAKALDRSLLVASVEYDPTLTPEERERHLSILNSRFYAGCLCNGLSLIVEALANNQFAQIGELLALPEIHADPYWNGLMPKILLATLYRKAVVVCDLARNAPPGESERDAGRLQP